MRKRRPLFLVIRRLPPFQSVDLLPSASLQVARAALWWGISCGRGWRRISRQRATRTNVCSRRGQKPCCTPCKPAHKPPHNSQSSQLMPWPRMTLSATKRCSLQCAIPRFSPPRSRTLAKLVCSRHFLLCTTLRSIGCSSRAVQLRERSLRSGHPRQ